MIRVKKERNRLNTVIVIILQPTFNFRKFFLSIVNRNGHSVVSPISLHFLDPIQLLHRCHIFCQGCVLRTLGRKFHYPPSLIFTSIDSYIRNNFIAPLTTILHQRISRSKPNTANVEASVGRMHSRSHSGKQGQGATRLHSSQSN